MGLDEHLMRTLRIHVGNVKDLMSKGHNAQKRGSVVRWLSTSGGVGPRSKPLLHGRPRALQDLEQGAGTVVIPSVEGDLYRKPKRIVGAHRSRRMLV
jgi:hypothetical protein